MPRQARKLFKRDVDDLKKKAKADPSFTAYVADAGQPGLHAWARRGRVRWVFAYRPPGGGPRRRMQIDDATAISLDAARKAAQNLRQTVTVDRKDPKVEEQQRQEATRTVKEVVTKYLADYAERVKMGQKGKASGYESAKRRLDRNVVPKLGNLSAGSLTEERITRWMRSLSHAPVEANRTWAAFRAAMNFDHRNTNIFHRSQRFPEKGERRNLDAEQLRALGDALRHAEEQGQVTLTRKGKKITRKIHPSAVLAIQLMALTGLRRADVVGHSAKNRRGSAEGLRWSDIDLKSGVLTLRDAKTGWQRRVIGQAAIDLLERVRPEDSEEADPVCPGHVPGQPLIGLDKPRRYLYEAAGIKGPGLDLHSLRHSFASVAANSAGGRYTGLVAPLIGHSSQVRSVTARYVHPDSKALRPAADAVSAEIARLLGIGESGKVVNFPKAGDR